MKILSLSEENVKRLSVVEMTLDGKGNLVIVAGRNEQGKSSVLDGIEWALRGGASLPPKPVRRGQDKATVLMTLGEIGLPELTVKRVITAAGGGSLVVTTKDGVKQPSPQAILDALVGKLSFDPLSFATMKSDERSRTTRALLGLDFANQDAEIKVHYDERTGVNRVVKAKEAMLTVNKRYTDVPAEEQSTGEILDEQEKAAAVNRENAAKRLAVERADQTISMEQARLKDKEDACEITRIQIKELQELLVRQESDVQDHRKVVAVAQEKKVGLPSVADLKDHDMSAFRQRVSDVEAINNKVRKNKEVDKIESELKEARKQAEGLTKKIDAIERAKRDAVAAAKFPVPGMTLDDSGEVLLDNLPFEQASTRGKIVASLAMGAALNPKLRVILVRSGNDLDDEALALVGEWAEANKMQIWLERIRTDGKVSVIIEDGHILEAEDAPQPGTKDEPAKPQAQQEMGITP